MALPLSSFLRRFEAEFAEEHPGFQPIPWESTRRWDLENSNWKDIDAKDPDDESIWEATDLLNAGEFEAAQKIWIDLADGGSVRSMIELGISYEFGSGVTQDPIQAEYWFDKARLGGSHYAALKCAEYAYSRRDFAVCESVLREAVEDGSASAKFWQSWYRHLLSNSRETCRSIYPLLKAAAKEGHPAGQAIFANFMLRGKFGRLRIPIGYILVVRFAFTESARQQLAESKSEGKA